MLNILNRLLLDVLNRLLNILHLISVRELSCVWQSTNLLHALETLLIKEGSLLILLLLLLLLHELFGLLFSHFEFILQLFGFWVVFFFWVLYFIALSPPDSLRFSLLPFEINFYCFKHFLKRVSFKIDIFQFQPLQDHSFH